MQITYYAGAADAAGTGGATLDAGDLTAADLVGRLAQTNEQLAGVLPVCSLLVDGRVVSGPDELIPAGSRVDVLPPFAGG